jgi:hypothetical protein
VTILEILVEDLHLAFKLDLLVCPGLGRNHARGLIAA